MIMNYRSFVTKISFLFFGVFLTGQISGQDANEGKDLFRTNCATCHNKNMKTASTGPALGGFQDRWADFPEEDLYTWVRASQSMVQANHPRAVEIFNEYKSVMQNFPNLTDDHIASIFAYINGVADGSFVVGTGVAADGGGGVGNEPKKTSNWIYFGLLGVLGILAVILTRLISRLRMSATDTDDESLKEFSFFEALTSKGMVSFLIFALILLAGYTTINNGIAFGRQQGYAPQQPIKFSHETHAGLHKIECQYCHDGARRSKHAVIPAVNTCMNCHKAIKNGTEYGTAEITKVFAASGFDPNTDTYVENYNDLPEEDLESMYKKWIADQYKEVNEVAELDREGKRMVEEQWKGIKESLTNDMKEKIQGPIEWTRVHNLPDHVYFNHSQHVNIGKIECQECHGKIEEMKLVGQYAPLSMGWCINCHRETEVKSFGNNNYYLESYKQYHDDIKSGKKEKITVEDIGGLECQKCHY